MEKRARNAGQKGPVEVEPQEATLGKGVRDVRRNIQDTYLVFSQNRGEGPYLKHV
jgi:hypothetical protein